MSKILLVAVAGLSMLPAVAYADEAPTTFTNDGVPYSYTVETRGNVRILRGSAFDGREPFELEVSKREVTGTFDGKAVEFPLRDGHDAAQAVASR